MLTNVINQRSLPVTSGKLLLQNSPFRPTMTDDDAYRILDSLLPEHLRKLTRQEALRELNKFKYEAEISSALTGDSFQQAAHEGRKGEMWIAYLLLMAGCCVALPNLSFSHQASFDGQVDLIANGQAIEVKTANKLQFTSPSDYNRSDIIIDSVSAYDKKNVLATCLISPTGGVIVVPQHTKNGWHKKRMTNRRGYTYDVYCAPRHTFRSFKSLIVKLNELT